MEEDPQMIIEQVRKNTGFEWPTDVLQQWLILDWKYFTIPDGYKKL